MPIPIPLAIFIGMSTSFIQSFALTVQRYDHIREEKRVIALGDISAKGRPSWMRPIWLVAFGIFITANIFGTVFQVGALPLVILAPLGAVSLLWNALFAKLILRDSFGRNMIIGTVFISSAALLISIFGIVGPEKQHSLAEIIDLFFRPVFLVFISLATAVVTIALITSHVIEYNLPPPIQLTDETRPSFERTRLLLGLSYASSSGILSGVSLLFAKAGVELLIMTFTGKGNQFKDPRVGVLITGLIVGGLGQLFYLNHALAFGSPTVICPLSFCLFNMASIFGGLIFYATPLSPLASGMVSLGVVLLIIGVWVVSRDETEASELAEEGLLAVVGAAGVYSDEPQEIPASSVEDETATAGLGTLLPRGRPSSIPPPSMSRGFSSSSHRRKPSIEVVEHTAQIPAFSIGFGPTSPRFSIRGDRAPTSPFFASFAEESVTDPMAQDEPMSPSVADHDEAGMRKKSNWWAFWRRPHSDGMYGKGDVRLEDGQ